MAAAALALAPAPALPCPPALTCPLAVAAGTCPGPACGSSSAASPTPPGFTCTTPPWPSPTGRWPRFRDTDAVPVPPPRSSAGRGRRRDARGDFGLRRGERGGVVLSWEHAGSGGCAWPVPPPGTLTEHPRRGCGTRVCAWTHVHMSAYRGVYTCVLIDLCIWGCVLVYVCAYVCLLCIGVQAHVCTCAYIQVHTSVCTCVYIDVCTHVHVHTHGFMHMCI